MQHRDTNSHTDMAILDLSKTDDTVPRETFFGKLQHYGMVYKAQS